MPKQTHTAVLGMPRIGKNRELKRAVESYWKGDIDRDDLERVAKTIRQENWTLQQQKGIQFIPSNDFSYYDQMLDLSCLLGVVPDRYNWNGQTVDVDSMFLMARGVKPQQAYPSSTAATDAAACEMTKWFDSNYHYIVPELSASTQFKISSDKIFDEFSEAKALGIQTRPALVGPITYLSLGKSEDHSFNAIDLADQLVDTYVEILQRLASLGATHIQMDEPILSTDLSAEQKDAFTAAYERLTSAVPDLKIIVHHYFNPMRENIDLVLNSPIAGFHLDLTHGTQDLDTAIQKISDKQILSLGLVNARNIWANDFEASLAILKPVFETLEDRLIVASSAPLQHVPVTLETETKLDEELKSWLAFAKEKVQEISLLGQFLRGEGPQDLLEANKAVIQSRRDSKRIHNPAVKERCANIQSKDFDRKSPFPTRRIAQVKSLGLPLFPTTTIGSFPQTGEIRKTRRAFKNGEISEAEYQKFMEDEIRDVVKRQEDMGIDMLVHGEPERNDMVEYFGEQLEGFTFTEFGWVQSYGSRCVKPPIIFGDVSRPTPMTVDWTAFAQTLSDKPMKGMLTGPITILQWSFVRDDQPRKDTTFQIALAIQDEVVDLEKAGIKAIQIDEPAIREGLPLRRSDWAEYLEWSVNAFRLSAAAVEDATQIHTHMCYSQFNDMIESIARLDADVISIEASRSKMDLLDAFLDFEYPNEIGPGVYDIHSPRVPSQEEMEHLLDLATKRIPVEQIWVNPDCGLKTRNWEEVTKSLEHMVAAAKTAREKYQTTPA